MNHKLGIIGYGGMGRYHHESVSSRINDITVKGVYDVREERRQLARESGLIAYGSLEELLCDEEIEIVTVATPNNFHKDISIKALLHGKNVVCEKPVTMSVDELTEIEKVAKSTGKLFTVHQNRRWDKDFRIIKKIYDESILGKPYIIESRVQGSKPVLAGWRGVKINGGGMVFDWGVHMLDQVMWMIKEPVVQVYANLFSIYSDEVDDNCRLYITFANGVRLMIDVSTNCFVLQPRWHMSCVDGTCVINDWSCNGNMVKLSENSDLGWTDRIVYTEAGPTRTMAPRPREQTQIMPLPEVETNWNDFYNNVAAVIEKRAEPIVKISEAMRVMKVIELCFKSAQDGTSINCNI